MSQFDEARDLLGHAGEELAAIQNLYQKSLDEKSIKSVLLIAIKNFMENLRSALDFTARGLYYKYGAPTKATPRIYFPYALKHQSLSDFRKSNRIEKCIPGLSASRPDVVTAIEDMQHWSSGYAWLPDFMDLNNENKHKRLTPQTRKESKQLKISSGGISIGLSEGVSIQMGEGTSIHMGGAVIPGGQTIDVDNPPIILGEGRSQIITWVSFHFAANDRPVIPFLSEVLDGVSQIVNDLSAR